MEVLNPLEEDIGVLYVLGQLTFHSSLIQNCAGLSSLLLLGCSQNVSSGPITPTNALQSDLLAGPSAITSTLVITKFSYMEYILGVRVWR